MALHRLQHAKQGALTRLWPYVVLTVFFIAVIWPWFGQEGYVFLLDFVPTPEADISLNTLRSLPLNSIAYRLAATALSHVTSSALAHTVLLSLPLLLSSISMYHLSSFLLKDEEHSVQRLASLTAGLFYAYNTFLTSRVFLGHIFFMYGYALLPWAVLGWLKWQDKPRGITTLRLGFILIGTCLLSPHHLVLAPLLLLFLVQPPQNLRPAHYVRYLAALFAFLGSALLVSLVRSGEALTMLSPAGPWARALLAPHSGHLLLDTLLLTATWKLDVPFLFPWEHLAWFTVASAVLLLSMTTSLWLTSSTQLRRWAIRFVALAGVAALLAIGVAHPLTAPVATWLYDTVPGWLSLRDSTKFISLIAVAESVLLSFAVVAIASVVSLPKVRIAASMGIMGLVIYLISPAFHGYSHQIYPQLYPASWHEVQAWLAEEHADPPRVLFLPWATYLPFSFTDYRTIANPAPHFFTAAAVVASTRNSVGGDFGRPIVSTDTNEALHAYVSRLVSAGDTTTQFGHHLRPLCIDYILLASTINESHYSFLYEQTDLELVRATPTLTLWRNTVQLSPRCFQVR